MAYLANKAPLAKWPIATPPTSDMFWILEVTLTLYGGLDIGAQNISQLRGEFVLLGNNFSKLTTENTA